MSLLHEEVLWMETKRVEKYQASHNCLGRGKTPASCTSIIDPYNVSRQAYVAQTTIAKSTCVEASGWRSTFILNVTVVTLVLPRRFLPFPWDALLNHAMVMARAGFKTCTSIMWRIYGLWWKAIEMSWPSREWYEWPV